MIFVAQVQRSRLIQMLDLAAEIWLRQTRQQQDSSEESRRDVVTNALGVQVLAL